MARRPAWTRTISCSGTPHSQGASKGFQEVEESVGDREAEWLRCGILDAPAECSHRVRAKSDPDEHPDEPSAVAQRLRTQAARTSLVVRVRLDQTVDGPRAVNGHGKPLSGQSARTEHPDYAESRESVSSRNPRSNRHLRVNPSSDSA